MIGEKIQKQVDDAKKDVRNQKSLYNPTYQMELPAKSSTTEEMIQRVENYLQVMSLVRLYAS